MDIEFSPVKALLSASELLEIVTDELSFDSESTIEITMFLNSLRNCLSSISTQEMHSKIFRKRAGNKILLYVPKET